MDKIHNKEKEVLYGSSAKPCYTILGIITLVTGLSQYMQYINCCIFCYFRFALGQQESSSGQNNVTNSFVFFATFMPGQTTEIRESKVARNTKELATLLWPEQLSCCPRAI